MIYVGIDLFKNLSVTMPVTFIENFLNVGGLGFITPMLILLVLGVTGIIVSYRKWCGYVEINVAWKKFFMKRGRK